MLQGPHYDFGTAFQLELIFIFVSLHCEPFCISFKMVTDCLMPIYQTRTFETEIPFQLKVVIHAKRAYKYVRNCIAFVILTTFVGRYKNTSLTVRSGLIPCIYETEQNLVSLVTALFFRTMITKQLLLQNIFLYYY